MNIDYPILREWIRKGLRWLVWVNVAVTLVFVALITALWFGPITSLEVASEQSAIIRNQAQQTLTREQVSQMITGKAPFRATGSVKDKVIDELSHFQLKGIAIKAGEKSAYIRDNKLKRTLIKKVGESIGHYEIIDITDQSIVIQRGAETLVMSKG